MRFVQGPPAVATFSGNAQAQRGQQSMKADNLRLDFDPDMKPLKITAQGGAVLDVSSTQGLAIGALGAASAPAAPAAAAQPAVAPPPPAAAQPAATAPPAAAQQPSHWRLTGETLIIEPPSRWSGPTCRER